MSSASSYGDPAGENPAQGRADDRDDSSKTTPATDLQAEDAAGADPGGGVGADGTPADRGQAQGERQRPERREGDRREQGPTEARARTAMKQESRTGEDR